MSEATFIALGAAAIGLLVTFFSVYVALAAKKKKASAQKTPASETRTPG